MTKIFAVFLNFTSPLCCMYLLLAFYNCNMWALPFYLQQIQHLIKEYNDMVSLALKYSVATQVIIKL